MRSLTMVGWRGATSTIWIATSGGSSTCPVDHLATLFRSIWW